MGLDPDQYNRPGVDSGNTRRQDGAGPYGNRLALVAPPSVAVPIDGGHPAHTTMEEAQRKFIKKQLADREAKEQPPLDAGDNC